MVKLRIHDRHSAENKLQGTATNRWLPLIVPAGSSPKLTLCCCLRTEKVPPDCTFGTLDGDDDDNWTQHLVESNCPSSSIESRILQEPVALVVA